MTTPIVTTVELNHNKGWLAGITTILTLVVPYILQYDDFLPKPWPQVIGLVIALLGTFGVVKIPAKPEGTVVVPADQVTTLPAGVGYTPVPDAPSTPYVPHAQHHSSWKT